MHEKRARGFTLIELLVVVAIIAILIAILIPSLGRVRTHAKTARCLSTIRGLNLTAQFYVTEWKKMVPYVADPAWNQVLRTTVGGGYGLTLKTRTCPEALTSDQVARGPDGTTWFGGAHSAWGNSPQTGNDPETGGPLIASYGLNGFVYSNTGDTANLNAIGASAAQNYVLPTKGFESRIPVFADATWRHFTPKLSDPVSPNNNLEFPGPYNLAAPLPMSYLVINRHLKAINVAFADGHVETVPLPKLWSISWSKDWIPRATPPSPLPSK